MVSTTLKFDVLNIKRLIAQNNIKELKRLNDIWQDSYKQDILFNKKRWPDEKHKWACIIGVNCLQL